MNDLAQKISDIIREYSHFPGPILQTQVKRLGITVDDISYADLPQLADYISKSIASFSNPVKGEEAKRKLMSII